MFQYISDNIRKKEKQKLMQNMNGEGIISADGRTAFLIDSSQKVLYIADNNNHLHKYWKDDILEVTIEKVDEKGHKHSLISTMLLYEIGKMIDKKNDLHEVLPRIATEKEIITTQMIFLRIYVKDFNTPYFDLIFYKKGLLANKKECYELAIRWHALINVLKHQ